jgi:Cu2+-exporting ATPase
MATRRVIRQNLLWALLYNLGAIPIAALGLMPPWLAALGMAGSSTLVMLNAIRLLAMDPGTQGLEA